MAFLRLIGLIAILFSLNTAPAFACGGDYGDYCDYSGSYDVGGYNLYSFSMDLSYIGNYSYSDSNYGGSCGSFSGCNSCYDVGMTSGYSGTNSFYNAGLIDWNFINQVNQMTGFGANPNMGGGNTGGYPGMYPTTGYPPTMGYPPTGYPPTMGYPPTGYPPAYPPTTSYPPTTNYPPVYPPTTYPPTNYYPPTTYYPPSTPPPTTTPYGGCDNIIVMCPGGPTTRPGGTPPVGNTPPNTIPTPPSNQPITSGGDLGPIRYRVPRGVTRSH